MSNDSVAGRKPRTKVVYSSMAVALITLVVVGVFAKNGWFPRTDGGSGKKFS